MTDNKNCFHGNSSPQQVCIDCNRILDSCRDKDCFERTIIYLTAVGQEIIEKTSNIKVKSTKVVHTCLDLEPIQFNRGFYQINVKFYTKINFEACISPGKPQEFDGIAVCEKKIILYGSQGNVNIFRSTSDSFGCCDATYSENSDSNAPFVVCEVTDPIALSVEVSKDDCCCPSPRDIPEKIADCLCSCLCGCDEGTKRLFVTLGFFSVIRIERPCQYMITATEYTIPDKVCVEAEDDDPCAAFAKMNFPVGEFYPPSYRDLN